MSMRDDYAFIRGSYTSEDGSRKNIHSIINRAQSDHKSCNYGVFNESGDNPVFFCTDKQGLMPGATIYHDLIQYQSSLTITLIEERLYLLFIKDGNVLYEDIVSHQHLSEAQTNTLKLYLFQLGKDAHLICNEQPTETDEEGVRFGDKLSLPFDADKVVIKSNLNNLFDTDNLLSSVEYKQLKLNGSNLRKRWIYTGASFAAALIVVIWVNAQAYFDNNGEQKPVQTSNFQNAIASISKTVPESDTPAIEDKVDYSGLVTWYTNESVQPKPVLNLLSKSMRLFQSIDGWEVIKASFEMKGDDKQGIIVIQLMEKEGADIKSVSDVAIRKKWRISFKDKIFTVFKKVDPQPLFRNAARFQVSSYEKYISMAIKDWWDGTTFDASDYQSVQKQIESSPQEDSEDAPEPSEVLVNQPFIKRLIKISKTDYTTFDLDSFGSLLHGYPYSLRLVEMTKEGMIKEENKRPRRSQQSPTESQSTDDFVGFDVNYELILAGVNNR